MSPRIAVFAATSGHSGVDRVLSNLVPELCNRGVPVDLLKVRGHGPEIDPQGVAGMRLVDLGVSHVNAALPAVVRYLHRTPVKAMLSDKDKVNRTAILARALARAPVRLAVRIGTTVSANLASRGRIERGLQRLSMRHLYPLADCVLVPSQGVAEDLADYAGVPRGLIRVVESPIVTSSLARLAAEPVDHPWLTDPAVPVVLGVGELGGRKDFATLLCAFALLRRQRPCRLIILGRGAQREPLLRLAGELGVSEHVDLPGFTANPYAFMMRAAVFVLSSRWEGFGIVLVEALACGTPVISTDCPHGPREILDDGRYGTLVPVGDADAMAAAIGLTLATRPQPEPLRLRALKWSVERSADAYLQALGMGIRSPAAPDEAVREGTAP